ncbi:MAG: tocopherol cyclase family protein [Candidatus Nanopelagicales bacterium]
MRGPVQRVRSVLRPDGYHGRGVRSGFFEGWYVKLVSADRSAPWAVIPGVFLGTDGDDHAFVQVLDGSTGRSWYLRYDVADFWASPDRFDVRVGPSRFTERGVDLDLPDGLLRGQVAFTDPLDPWPVTLGSPGIMGWYSWVPFMECYHGICSFGHGLAGSLEVDGAPVSFDGGRGYLEKDWGQAFPAGYVWVHSNHLAADPDACLTASVALIPWLRGSFRGFIVGLRTRDRLYRWATYTGARETHLEIDDAHVRWGLTGPDGRIELVAERTRGGLLHAPVRTSMHERVEETLDARVHVTLHDAGGRRVLDTTAGVAALEVVGDLDRLLAVGTR